MIVALLSRDFIRFISTTNSCRLWICHVTHFHCFAHTRMVFVQIHSRVPFANVNSILIIWFFFSSHILFCANFRFLFSVCSFLFWILTSIKMYIYLHGLRSICLRLSFIYFILLHACCFSHIARERMKKREAASGCGNGHMRRCQRRVVTTESSANRFPVYSWWKPHQF